MELAKMNFLSFYRHLKVIIVRVPLQLIRGQVFVLCLAGFLRSGNGMGLHICRRIILSVSLSTALTSCYSFTGGSIPSHLKTLSIPLADDTSGFGNAQLRENLTQQLVQAFRRENAFSLVQERSDAVLEVSITNISEVTATVQQTSAQQTEAERDKQVIVSVKVVYQDIVKQKQIWEKQFAPPQTYAIASGLQGRDAAIERALKQIANDVLLAVVSGW
jgi:hypothetical protein